MLIHFWVSIFNGILEAVFVGRQKAHRLHVLMRNGDKYTLFMGKLQAIEIAEYLKNALSPS